MKNPLFELCGCMYWALLALAPQYAAAKTAGSVQPADTLRTVFFTDIYVTPGNTLVFGAWDRHLYCLDAGTGELLWKWNNGSSSVFLSPGHVVPRIAGGKVFIVAPDRVVTCLDLATGQQLWRDNSRKSRETTGLSGDGRQFYYKTMDGELAALDTSAHRYRELWCTDLGWGYEYNSCPAFVRDGVVYVAGRQGTVAAVREDGTLLWTVKCCNSAGNDFAQAPDGSLWATFAEGKIFRIP